jgi:hypothetical protein
MPNSSYLRAGEWVEVRGKAEILSTLDRNGQLEGLPFMPEMLEFCGQRFRVFKRAHKTCDPPNGLAGRRMLRAVHLEGLRCDGAGHGGCQARCLIFWKEDWLKPVEGAGRRREAVPAKHRGCTEAEVRAGAIDGEPSAAAGEPVYVCQSTRIPQATLPLRWWDFSQYVEDYRSGNATLGQLLAAGFVFCYGQLVSAGLGLGSGLRWIYDAVQRLRGATLYPWREGQVPPGQKTPAAKLDLQPGELVRVRSYREILTTIDAAGHNRGMSFDAEMVPFCDRTYKVLDRVSTIINEKTGKMQRLKNDCIILDDVVCLACYAKYRRFCPRAIYPYWREVWLDRVKSPAVERSRALQSPEVESPAVESPAGEIRAVESPALAGAKPEPAETALQR